MTVINALLHGRTMLEVCRFMVSQYNIFKMYPFRAIFCVPYTTEDILRMNLFTLRGTKAPLGKKTMA